MLHGKKMEEKIYKNDKIITSQLRLFEVFWTAAEEPAPVSLLLSMNVHPITPITKIELPRKASVLTAHSY